MRDHRNGEVHHFQRHRVWTDATAYVFLDHQRGCKGVRRPEVYRKTMHKHWQHMVRTAAVPSITVPIHHHQVCTPIKRSPLN